MLMMMDDDVDDHDGDDGDDDDDDNGESDRDGDDCKDHANNGYHDDVVDEGHISVMMRLCKYALHA